MNSRSQSALSILLAIAAFVALSACGGKSATPAPSSGTPVLEVLPSNGEAEPFDGILDFGPTLIGDTKAREVRVRNTGTGTMLVRALDVDGALAPDFTIEFEAATLIPDASMTFAIAFKPTAVGARASTVTLVLDNAVPDTFEIQLQGSGIDGLCTLHSPENIEFGEVAVGTGFTRSFTFLNHATIPQTVTFAAFLSDSPYQFADAFAPGEHLVPARNGPKPGVLEVAVEFRPITAGRYDSALHILPPTSCPTAIPLHGVAAVHAIVCEPAVPMPSGRMVQVQFGYVHPMSKGIAQLRCRALGADDVHIQVASITAPFAIDGDLRSFVIAHGDAPTAIDLSFSPVDYGEQVGAVTFTTDAATDPAFNVQLVGIGGGAEVAVEPVPLEFGVVGVGSYVVRSISLKNLDCSDSGDVVRFGQFVDGRWVDAVPEITGADASQFTLVWPPPEDVSGGLPCGHTAHLRVRFSPTSVGEKDAVLVLHTNDAQVPRLEVPISATAAALPACGLDVTPSALEFGNVEPGKYLTLALSIVNADPETSHACAVNYLGLVEEPPFNSAAFTIVDAPAEHILLQGGERLLLHVRFAPESEADYRGQIRFFIANPARPEVTVDLHGYAEAACIMIAPRELDFGVVGTNCNSRQRTFTMYNTCTAPVTVTSIELMAGYSSSFAITKRPTLPTTISGGASSEFGITFRPTVEGATTAAASVAVRGASVPYIVPLEGQGAPDPIQVDVFTDPPPPKFDILFVVDNSSSMADKLASLARNFAAFIHYAVQQKIDFHLAVTTTDVSSTGAAGRFLPLTGTNPRVITPTTANKEPVFNQNVSVGTDGTETESLIRPAYLALSNPLLTSHNAGFYRDEARLNVVVVSDAADHDPDAQAVSYYEAFFLNLKGLRRRNDFTFSGVIPLQQALPSGAECSYDETDAGQDSRVKQLIQRTGGLMDEICNPDWSKTLEKFGTRVFGMRTTYFLSNVPDMTVTPDPIVITLNGVRFDQYGDRGDKRWDYNSAYNAIEFDPLAVPDPGTTMTVRYHVACL